MNILITAASRRVALVKYFKRALNELGIKGSVIATDTDPGSPALYFTDNHHLVPLSSADNYIDVIKTICKNEGVKIIIPTIDEELPIFGKHREAFKEMGVTVMISNEETGRTCLDKFETSLFFKKHKLPFAETLLPENINLSEINYPMFVKPRRGRGGVGAFRVNNERELLFFTEYVHEPIVQNFLEGREYTIDLLCDLDGRVISVVPRERVVIRSGVCDRGVTVKDQALIDYAVKIAGALNISGPANFQCKVHRGRVTFFELNPRFSGAIQLTIESGADFPRMIVEMASGIEIRPVIGEFIDGLRMVSYEESIYLESDGGYRQVFPQCTPTFPPRRF